MIPNHMRPTCWEGIGDPVCPVLRNLYGHPLAGLLWEKHAEKILFEKGFERVPGRECLYVHRPSEAFRSVYVHDFKIACPTKSVDGMWVELRNKLDGPVHMDGATYLGCAQRNVEIPQEMVNEKSELFRSKWASHIQENSYDLNSTQVPDSRDALHEIKGWVYNMSGHAEQCVERYLDLSNKGSDSLKRVSTPCLDTDEANPGELGPVAAMTMLKALYLTRLSRPDILWAVNDLARKVAKGTRACDKKLRRLMS